MGISARWLEGVSAAVPSPDSPRQAGGGPGATQPVGSAVSPSPPLLRREVSNRERELLL